jgi:2-hydroxychromene-2-carboxylate isomerase
MQLDFWFDFASPYSYLAASRVEGLALDAGVGVSWKPFLMGSLFQAQGWGDSPFRRHPTKDRYLWRDVERRCRKYGLAFQHPSRFPQNGLLATRVATVVANETWLPQFVQAVYRASFAEMRDISDPATISEILRRLGQPTDDTISRARAEENKQALRAQTQRAADIGIFGAPTFAIQTELFWGNDRLEDAIDWCVEAARATRTPRQATPARRRTTLRGVGDEPRTLPPTLPHFE